MGDPAGIGPEIVVRSMTSPALRRVADMIAVGDPDVIARAASRLRPRRAVRVVDGGTGGGGPGGGRAAAWRAAGKASSAIPVIASTEDGWMAVTPGVGTAASGRMAARAIETAARLALEGRVSGIVTAPISKAALQAAGYPYPGHTEFLGALAGAPETRMLFVGKRFRILLATVHLPLRSVPDALNADSLSRTIEYAALAARNFRWPAKGAVAVLGLNPHAGEGGLFGDEEARVIEPAIARARGLGIRVEGPYPADTFYSQHAGRRDLGVVVAMYHDQGLIAAQGDGIGGAANVTLGLPFVRSSVDHGTAFNRAWKSGSRGPDPAGMATAIRVGADLASRAPRPLDWTWH
jgi:4-hydroxythreonine-4-phosphate dehydrogenase